MAGTRVKTRQVRRSGRASGRSGRRCQVLYLSPADHDNGPLQSRRRGVNQPARVSPIGVVGLASAFFACGQAHLTCDVSRSPAHPWLTALGVAAMGAPERARPRIASRQDRSSPPPWLGYWSATASPTLYRELVRAPTRAGVSWREADKSCGTSGRMPAGTAPRLRPYTTC